MRISRDPRPKSHRFTSKAWATIVPLPHSTGRFPRHLTTDLEWQCGSECTPLNSDLSAARTDRKMGLSQNANHKLIAPLQKLDKAVKIQFLSDFHGFIVGLILRKFYFETAPSSVSKKPRRVCRPQAAKGCQSFCQKNSRLTQVTTFWPYWKSSPNFSSRGIRLMP